MQWNQLEKIQGNTRILLHSRLWLYSLFDYMLGGELQELNHPSDSPNGTKYRAYAVVKDNAKYILLAALNLDHNSSDTRTITLQVPRKMMSIADTSSIRYVNTTSNVYDVIQNDMNAADMLQANWKGTPYVSWVSTMAKDPSAAKTYVNNNWDRYKQITKDSLTLKPFSNIGSVSWTANSGYYTFTVTNVSPHSVTVIAIDKR
jgi:hypothetical protein